VFAFAIHRQIVAIHGEEAISRQHVAEMVSLFAIKQTDENRNVAGSGRPTYEQGRNFDQDAN